MDSPSQPEGEAHGRAEKTVLHNPEHPTKLVIGVLEDGPAAVPCGKLASLDIAPVPGGSILISPWIVLLHAIANDSEALHVNHDTVARLKVMPTCPGILDIGLYHMGNRRSLQATEQPAG